MKQQHISLQRNALPVTDVFHMESGRSQAPTHQCSHIVECIHCCKWCSKTGSISTQDEGTSLCSTYREGKCTGIALLWQGFRPFQSPVLPINSSPGSPVWLSKPSHSEDGTTTLGSYFKCCISAGKNASSSLQKSSWTHRKISHISFYIYTEKDPREFNRSEFYFAEFKTRYAGQHVHFGLETNPQYYIFVMSMPVRSTDTVSIYLHIEPHFQKVRVVFSRAQHPQLEPAFQKNSASFQVPK